MRQITKTKKAQQEILGFALIVVIVTIMGLVFLSFSVGKDRPKKQTSAEISNLLEACMYYTTDCAINYVPQYREIQDLVKDCYNSPNQKCLDGQDVCSALDKNLKQVVTDSLSVSEDSPNKAYKLNMYYNSSNSIGEAQEILSFEEGKFGNCSSTPGGSHSIAITTGSGVINTELELCVNTV